MPAPQSSTHDESQQTLERGQACVPTVDPNRVGSRRRQAGAHAIS